jgi:diaminohydroxyphosphoribosylaminopyrimidine deaminase/5-amino-6-(5-phosphoribosylamino)uracil reductase
MDQAQYAKFSQYPDIRAELIGTGNAEIINGDQTDTFWGVGVDGHGQNQMGQSLMRVRERLKREGAGR